MRRRHINDREMEERETVTQLREKTLWLETGWRDNIGREKQTLGDQDNSFVEAVAVGESEKGRSL